MTARRQIWDTAGKIDSAWGRLKVLAAAFSALVATSLVVWAFLEDRFGSVGIVALSLAAIFAVPPIVVSIVGVRRWAARAAAEPRVRHVDLAVEYGQQVVWLPLRT